MCINVSVIVIIVKNALTDRVTFQFGPKPYHFYYIPIKFEHFWIIRLWLMPRLHQASPGNMYPGRATCIRIYMSTDTCRWIQVARPEHMLTVSRRHIKPTIHGRLVSLCIQQQTGDKLATVLKATILSPIQETCWRQQVDTTCIRQHVSWCKRSIVLRTNKQTNRRRLTLYRRQTLTARVWVLSCFFLKSA